MLTATDVARTERTTTARIIRTAGAALLALSIVIGLSGLGHGVAQAAVTKPSITRLSPAGGPVKGGTTLTITGKKLKKTSAVTVGGVKATKIKIVSDTKVTVRVPKARSSKSAVVSVKITTGKGKSARSTTAKYRYAAVPTLTKISSVTGLIAGGGLVTLTGRNLTGATKVTFGTAVGENLKVTKDTSLTVRVPVAAGVKAGAVAVRVTTPGGVTKSVTYTYTAASRATRPAVSSGLAFSLALKKDGSVWAWGSNATPLGTGSTRSALSTAAPVLGLSGVTDVDAGNYHSVALKKDGTVWAWGANYYGELGDGTTTTRKTPVKVAGLSNVDAVAAGDGFTVAVRRDGKVFAWGSNSSYQLGRVSCCSPSFYRSLKSIQVGGVSHVTAIDAGDDHVLAIRGDRTVWTWGGNAAAQLGVPASTPARAKPLQVLSSGRGDVLTGVVEVAAGEMTSYVRRSNGSVYSWGSNQLGQAGQVKAPLKNSHPVPVWTMDSAVSAMAAGRMHGLAVKGGAVYAWGFNLHGTTIGIGAPTKASGAVHDPWAIGLMGVRSVSAGEGFSVVVKTDGTVWAWGEDSQKQLGNDTATGPWPPFNTGTPVQVKGLNLN